MIKDLVVKSKSLFDRGSNRTINAKKNILAMFFLKGLSILLSLLVVPLTIGFISTYEYGIWLTISSLVSWLSFFDVGFGNGLKNKFIEALSLGKIKLAKIYVSTTYAILILITILVWFGFSVICFFVDFSEILKVPNLMSLELKYVVFIALTSFCFQFILKLIITLLNAIQKPAIGSLFDTISQLLVVIFLLIFNRMSISGSLIYLSIALGSFYNIVLLIGSVWAFSSLLKEYKPSIKFVKFKYAKVLISLGIKFFLLQIISIVIYQTNNIIISRMLGPEEVTVYNIAFKYTSILNMFFMVIITPFWSAFAEAITVGDYNWMKNVAKKLRLTFVMLCLIGILMVGFSQLFYKLWLGNKIEIPFIVTALMYIYQMFNIWSTLHTQLLSGVGKIKLQLLFSSVTGILYLPIILNLCEWFGISGILFGNILLLLLFNSWFGFLQINKILNQTAKGIWNE